VIVLDASAVLEILLRTPAGEGVLRRLATAARDAHAPELLDVEVAQVLRRLTLAGSMTAARGELALDHLTLFPVHRHSHRRLLRRIWELRANVTAYDAAYLALAEVLGATVVTTDRKLARAPGHGARVEVL
jgi:predicted nucleic acid-binding protein